MNFLCRAGSGLPAGNEVLVAAFAEEQRCRPTQQTHPERRSSTKRSPNKGVISLTLLEPAGLASGWAGVMAIKLQTQSVMATAPQELCFEVVAAAGRKVEEISPTERVVEFKTTYRGREVVTLERLHQEPPALIDYEWVKGPPFRKYASRSPSPPKARTARGSPTTESSTSPAVHWPASPRACG